MNALSVPSPHILSFSLNRNSVGRHTTTASFFNMMNRKRRNGKCLVSEQDGMIIVDHGSREQMANSMLEEFVVMFKNSTGHKIVEPAHMELAEPSIRAAFDACVKKGACRIILTPLFLFNGRHVSQDIPRLAEEAAKEHKDVSYFVTSPLGLHPSLLDVVNDRIRECLCLAVGVAEEDSIHIIEDHKYATIDR